MTLKHLLITKAAMVALGIFSLLAAPVASAGQRPISDWLDQQVNITGSWGNQAPQTMSIFFDFFGSAQAFWALKAPDSPHLWEPPIFSGSINEWRLKDGSAEVHVILHSRNVIVVAHKVMDVKPDERPDLLFGNWLDWVCLGGETPAFGDCTFQKK